MADVKISDMTPGSTLTGSELFEMTQAAATHSTTANALRTFIQSTGGQKWNYRVITTSDPVTVAASDYVLIIKKSVGSATAVALPAGVDGTVYAIKDGKGDATSNNITITPDGSETIDGGATYVMSSNYQSITMIFAAGQWNLI
jgi:hypothetical protein